MIRRRLVSPSVPSIDGGDEMSNAEELNIIEAEGRIDSESMVLEGKAMLSDERGVAFSDERGVKFSDEKAVIFSDVDTVTISLLSTGEIDVMGGAVLTVVVGAICGSTNGGRGVHNTLRSNLTTLKRSRAPFTWRPQEYK